MMTAIYILLGISLFFAVAGVVGLIRLKDTLSRMQSATNIYLFHSGIRSSR